MTCSNQRSSIPKCSGLGATLADDFKISTRSPGTRTASIGRRTDRLKHLAAVHDFDIRRDGTKPNRETYTCLFHFLRFLDHGPWRQVFSSRPSHRSPFLIGHDRAIRIANDWRTLRRIAHADAMVQRRRNVSRHGLSTRLRWLVSRIPNSKIRSVLAGPETMIAESPPSQCRLERSVASQAWSLRLVSQGTIAKLKADIA